MKRIFPAFAVALAAAVLTPPAQAAQCGNSGAGFHRWVDQFRGEAARRGFSQKTLDRALNGISYRQETISADRNQHSFKLSLDAFMQKRGSATIVAKGKRLKRKYASLFSGIESRYGVPPGPLVAIWGMETGFGSFMGGDRAIPALATLAYDCRRSAFFTRQLYAALTLVQRGELAPGQMVSARHGELGQTQFLPTNYVQYAVDGNGDGRRDLIGSVADALASTANYLRAHGWQPGAGYQPGQANYRVIQSWNDASVYQRALAIMGRKIDG